MRRILIILFVLFPLIVHSEEVCDTSKDPVNADVEESPLKDKDYSAAKVLKALDGLKIYIAKEDQGQYFIPENYMTIIEGGFLLRRTKLFKMELEKIDQAKKPYRYSDRKQDYETAKKEYCEYRKSHFLFDW